MALEPVEPYFTRFLRVLSFCLGASNGVVNGVVEGAREIWRRVKINDEKNI